MLSVGFSHSQDRFFQTLNGPSVVFTTNTDIILLWKTYFWLFFFKKRSNKRQSFGFTCWTQCSLTESVWVVQRHMTRVKWCKRWRSRHGRLLVTSGSYPSPNAQKISLFNHFSPEVPDNISYQSHLCRVPLFLPLHVPAPTLQLLIHKLLLLSCQWINKQGLKFFAFLKCLLVTPSLLFSRHISVFCPHPTCSPVQYCVTVFKRVTATVSTILVKVHTGPHVHGNKTNQQHKWTCAMIFIILLINNINCNINNLFPIESLSKSNTKTFIFLPKLASRHTVDV